MSASKDIQIDAGSKYVLTVTYQDATGAAINTTGWGARFMMRAAQDPTSAPSIPSQLTVGSGITNGGVTGVFTITLTALQALAITIFVGYYDLFIDPDVTASANSIKLLVGRYAITRNVAT